jgi:hypothetical protein
MITLSISIFSIPLIFISDTTATPSVEMLIQNGHKNEVRDIESSTDGSLLVSAGAFGDNKSII